jgi:hypothetical protein
MAEYIDSEQGAYQEPGGDYMRDPNIINSVNGVPTVEALLRKMTNDGSEEYWT